MGVFYDARSAAVEAVESRNAGRLPNPIWWRVLVALGVAIGLFFLALHLERTGEYVETSKTVLHILEVVVTASLALLGIETAKA